ncbi:hypothetical protein HHI36_008913 [Cryptolaemus montrouzieri]|uniref:Large ribosomal subunit protein mL64 n=1 Tax=Cryptolaemus montrouzieri TaxID=559131 RepID=A0ABD2MUM9_9CUCU
MNISGGESKVFLRMIRKELIIRPPLLGRIFNCYFSSKPILNIEKLEQESAVVDVVDEETKFREEQIERSRNKSRLNPADRNFLFDINPFPEEIHWYHGTLKYKRRLYGRYGKDSGIDPSICWPTDQELQDSVEYEKVAHPFTIPEMIQMAQKERAMKLEETQKRQKDMLIKLSKVEGWKKEMEMRIAKKEAEANAARQKRERLIEEVRKHFGYKVDPKDDKFKELLEKKEKEQKKLAKEARKKEKEAKLMEKLNKKNDNKNTKTVEKKDKASDDVDSDKE